MREERSPVLHRALYRALIFVVAAVGSASIISASIVTEASAQSQARSGGQSRAALYAQCRRAMFRKYGQPGVQYNRNPRSRVLPTAFLTQNIDQCVASGGRMD